MPSQASRWRKKKNANSDTTGSLVVACGAAVDCRSPHRGSQTTTTTTRCVPISDADNDDDAYDDYNDFDDDDYYY